MTLNVSLTQHWLIDPILIQQAKANLGVLNLTRWSRIKNQLKAQLICRVAALFASFTCLLDGLYHFKEALRKTVYLLLRKFNLLSPLNWCRSDIQDHLKRGIFFTMMVFTSSLVGFINPHFFNYFQWTPRNPLDLTNKNVSEDQKLELALQLAPESIQQLIMLALKDPYATQADVIKTLEKGFLQERYHLVQILNLDYGSFKILRQKCGKNVYKHPNPSKAVGPFWSTPAELRSLETKSERQSSKPCRELHEASFFYSIPLEAFAATLKAGRVAVSYDKLLKKQLVKGAFVSHHLISSINTCTLVFRSNIERLSPLSCGFYSQDEKVYWAGFSQPIPITNATLVGVIVRAEDQKEEMIKLTKDLESLKGCAKDLHPTHVKLYDFSQAEEIIKEIQKRVYETGIPKEWP